MTRTIDREFTVGVPIGNNLQISRLGRPKFLEWLVSSEQAGALVIWRYPVLTDSQCKNAKCPAQRPRARLADSGGLGSFPRWFQTLVLGKAFPQTLCPVYLFNQIIKHLKHRVEIVAIPRIVIQGADASSPLLKIAAVYLRSMRLPVATNCARI